MLTFQSGGGAAGASRALLTPQQQRSLAERIRGHEPSAEEALVRLFGDRVRVLVLARTRDGCIAACACAFPGVPSTCCEASLISDPTAPLLVRAAYFGALTMPA